MIVEKISIKIKKKHRCKSCSSDDNMVSNQEYILYMEEHPRYNSRLWMWNKENTVGYFTDTILKKYDGVLITKNAKYEYEYI